MVATFRPMLLNDRAYTCTVTHTFRDTCNLGSLMCNHVRLSIAGFDSVVRPAFFTSFARPRSFHHRVIRTNHQLASRQPSAAFLLVTYNSSCDRLLDQCGSRLGPCFAFISISTSLRSHLDGGASFCRLYTRCSLPRPLAFILSGTNTTTNGRRYLPFNFPITIGPTGDIRCLRISFPKHGGTFVLRAPRRLTRIISTVCNTNCNSRLVVRSFVPNSSTGVHILGTCISRSRRIHVVILNRILLTSPAPRTVNGCTTVVPSCGRKFYLGVGDFLRDVKCRNITGFSVGFSPHSKRCGLFRVGLHRNHAGFFIALGNFGLTRCFISSLILNGPVRNSAIVNHNSDVLLRIPFSALGGCTRPKRTLSHKVTLRGTNGSN